jgi:hypothetical protein
MPAVPDSGGVFMQRLIRSCLMKGPSHRPSFQKILNDFKLADFEILQDADPVAIENAVTEVTT